MRMIDAERLRALIVAMYEPFPNICNVNVVLTAIDIAPTIEAPVRHGRWLSYTGTHYTGKENEYGDPEYKEHIFFVCSNCRRKTVVREHFCPNCGADMREEGADNGNG